MTKQGSVHPSLEELDAFLRRPGPQASASRLVEHLLRRCHECWHRLAEIGWDWKRLDKLLFVGTGATEFGDSRQDSGQYNYDAAFRKAEAAIDAFFTATRLLEESPETLLALLEPLPVNHHADLIATDDRFTAPQFVDFLIDSSHAMRYQDPERMLRFSNLARLGADACNAEAAGGPLRLADLQGRAWGYYGNSMRICGRLKEAEQALARAAKTLQQGTGDPTLRARLLEQMASLCIYQRRFEEAAGFAAEAGRVYRDLGDAHQLASSMIQRAISVLYSGEPEAAVAMLNRAIPLVDHESDPHLLLAACHNLVRCYIDLDRPEQALSIFSETRDLYKEFDDPLILLRAEWQEGQLLRDLGHLRASEESLLHAQQGFLSRGLSYEGALVSLDLAALYIKLGSLDDLKQTAVAAVPVFRALGVDREGIASLLQLQHVADKEQQAMELIRFLNARLEPLASRPGTLR